MEGYQAWEVLLKLPEPDLKTAFEIAQNLGFDMAIMTELLPTAIHGMKEGIHGSSKETIHQT